MESKQELEFYKSVDFMRLGQAVSRKKWQSAAMIIRRMDMMAREAGITDFEKNLASLRQCINRKDEKEAKQILALVVSKRAKYLNTLSTEEKINRNSFDF